MTLPKPPPLPTDLDLEPFQVAGPEESTQREGMLRDPRDLLISSLQQELHTLQLLQQTPSEPPQPSGHSGEFEPAPETRPSQLVARRQRQIAVTLRTLKGIAALLLPILGAVVAKHWPAYSGLVDWAGSLVGLQ